MSKAFVKFRKTIKRCEKLKQTYDLQKVSTEKPGNQDLLRASIVLSVAAMDAYMTDVFSEYFIEYIKRWPVDDKMEEQLIKYGVTVKFIIEMYKAEKPLSEIRALVERHYERATTQRMSVIDDLFSLYRIQKITENAAKRIDDTMIINDIEAVVQRRHSIVHDGDYYQSQNIRNVTEEDMKKAGKIDLFVESIEFILSRKFSIRNEEGGKT